MKTIEVTRKDSNSPRKMTLFIEHIEAVDEGQAASKDNGCIIYTQGYHFWVTETREAVLDLVRAAQS